MKQTLYLLICRCFSIIILFSVACHNNQESEQKPSDKTEDNSPENINFKVVNAFPHDTTSYTEGLLFYKGLLFESTGHTNTYPSSRSAFGPVDLKNGRIDIKAEIDKNKYFGEGIAFLNDRIYQLTDTTHIGFIYHAETYKKLGTFTYDGDGWGLTTNGKYIIMSNGSSNIYYRDPSTFKIIKTINVTDNNGPAQNINELEMIHGYIYANQWLTDNILKIDTTTGKVVGKLDLSSLKTEVKMKYPFSEETNGIAYDSVTNKVFVTGKLWPLIYEIQFNH
ncbi:MAG TPA: glutaminyl-peptide cyclotransferase [Puia sp.]|nr:glutaminyl-peptide cyclotransferase [Puia sp.]